MSNEEKSPIPAPVGGAELPKKAQPQESLPFQVRMLNKLVIGLLFVLFIGFAGMFVATAGLVINSLKDKQATYLNLIDKVNDTNTKIDFLLQKK